MLLECSVSDFVMESIEICPEYLQNEAIDDCSLHLSWRLRLMLMGGQNKIKSFQFFSPK